MENQPATDGPASVRSRTPRPTLGLLPPLLGLLEAVGLLVLAFIIWRFFNSSRLAAICLPAALLLAFIPYFFAIYVCGHPQAVTTVRAVIFFSMIFRLIFLATPPELSDDVFRYCWEGRVQNHGFNPYQFAPDAQELQPLRDALYGEINHRDVAAIYPPFAQLVFRVLAAIPHPVGWAKFFFGGIDLLNVWLLVRILREKKLPPQFALIYGWNPLPALEFAGNGHCLSLAICLFLAAYHAVQRGRHLIAAVAGGLALGAHFLILAPLLSIYTALKKRWFPVLVAVFALLYLPYLSAGAHLIDGLSQYASMWKFNDSLFGLLVRWFDGSPQAWSEHGIHLMYPHAKMISVLILAALALWCLVRQKDWLRSGYLLTGALILLSPTVHPWYATLILPFLCFYRNVAWLMFTALVTIGYVSVVVRQLDGSWVAISLFPTKGGMETALAGWLEYGTFFVLLAWTILRRRKEPAS